MHVGRQLEITRALHNILEKSFPEEYEARKQETLNASSTPRDAVAPPLPLFVMSCIMPGMGQALIALGAIRALHGGPVVTFEKMTVVVHPA